VLIALINSWLQWDNWVCRILTALQTLVPSIMRCT